VIPLISNIAKIILEEASKEAEKILNDAKSVADKILEDAKRKADAILKEAIREAEKKASEKVRALAFDAERRYMELKREVQRTAYEIAEESFKVAARKLLQVTEKEDYVDILYKLILEAVQQLREAELKVAVNRRDMDLVRRLLPRIESEASRIMGVKIRISLLEKPIDIVGGAVVMTADEKIIYNNSLEAKLESSREKLLPLLVRKLIPEVVGK
jgi:V/A-type H+-transporting ATPase subunit E